MNTIKIVSLGYGRYHIELPCGHAVEGYSNTAPQTCPTCGATFVGVRIVQEDKARKTRRVNRVRA